MPTKFENSLINGMKNEVIVQKNNFVFNKTLNNTDTLVAENSEPTKNSLFQQEKQEKSIVEKLESLINSTDVYNDYVEIILNDAPSNKRPLLNNAFNNLKRFDKRRGQLEFFCGCFCDAFKEFNHDISLKIRLISTPLISYVFEISSEKVFKKLLNNIKSNDDFNFLKQYEKAEINNFENFVFSKNDFQFLVENLHKIFATEPNLEPLKEPQNENKIIKIENERLNAYNIKQWTGTDDVVIENNNFYCYNKSDAILNANTNVNANKVADNSNLNAKKEHIMTILQQKDDYKTENYLNKKSNKNYSYFNENDFINEARLNAGLIISCLKADGRKHRCPTERNPKSQDGEYQVNI